MKGRVQSVSPKEGNNSGEIFGEARMYDKYVKYVRRSEVWAAKKWVQKVALE